MQDLFPAVISQKSVDSQTKQPVGFLNKKYVETKHGNNPASARVGHNKDLASLAYSVFAASEQETLKTWELLYGRLAVLHAAICIV